MTLGPNFTIPSLNVHWKLVMVCPGDTLPALAKVISAPTAPGFGEIRKLTAKTGDDCTEFGLRKRIPAVKLLTVCVFTPIGLARMTTLASDPRFAHSGNGSGTVG